MTLLRTLAIALIMLVGAVAPAMADKAIIVLDGSGSMWAQIDGRARITIARETLRSVLQALPPDLELGLMSYGHRQKGDCSDIELLIPPAAGTADDIATAADRLNPLGKTPISAAVDKAAHALSFTTDKATVILITDGIETCEANPCDLAADLETQGIDFTAHVVGFGLTEEEGRQVACIAENTGGTYFEASDAAGLAAALTTTVSEVAQAEIEPAPVPEPEPSTEPQYSFLPDAVLSEGGPSLGPDAGNVWEVYRATADGQQGEYLSTGYGNAFRAQLDPGDYIVVASIGQASVEQPVTIVEGEVTEPTFVLNAGQLLVHPRPTPNGGIDTGAAVYVEYPNSNTTSYGDASFYLPAGEATVTVTIGAGSVTEPVTIVAGETIERDIVVGVGRAIVNAYYVEDMKVEDSGLAVAINKTSGDVQGNLEYVTTSYGPDTTFDLMPGDYVATLTYDQAAVDAPFTIAAGEQTEVGAILDAGVLAISAPGATSIEVFGAKKDIQGNRKGFGVGYGEAHQTTLPAGDYAVVATLGDGTTKEAAATVVAGERLEIAVE
jgi:Ca-activated chloride channel homolog